MSGVQMRPPPNFGGGDPDDIIGFDVGPGGYMTDDDFVRPAKQKGNKNKQHNNAQGTFNNTKNNSTDKNTTNQLVEIQYEGYMLEKAEPRIGERPSWARVGRRALPFSDAKLAEMSRKARVESGIGPATQFANLTADQQGVIDRLITKRQSEEKTKNAEWSLDCVRRYKERLWWTRTIKVTKIQVILKRQDRNATVRNGQKITSSGARFQSGEIIDLLDPLPKKSDKAEKTEGGGKKNKDANHGHNNAGFNDFNEPLMTGPFPDPFQDMGPPLNMPGGPMPFEDNRRPQGGPQQGMPPPPPMNHGPPPGAIPIPGAFPPMNDFDRQPPQQHPSQPFGPPPFPQDPHQNNPFQPDPQFRGPMGLDNPFPRVRTVSRSQSPRSLSRDRVRDARIRAQSREAIKNTERVERKVDDIDDKLDEVMNKVSEWKFRPEHQLPRGRGRERYRDSSASDDSSLLEGDFFSAPPSGGSFTPMSTPPRSPLMGGPSGTLGRNRRRERDVAYPSSRGYNNRDTQVIIEPYSSRRRQTQLDDPYRRQGQNQLEYGGGRDRRRSDQQLPYPISRRQSQRQERPILHHSNTWNDYPDAPVAEPRYHAQRALPQYPNDDGFANFGRSNRDRGYDRGYDTDRRRRNQGWERDDMQRVYGGGRRNTVYN